MKKVGIITLNGYYNYGNRLQNYALQRVLEKMGYSADTILNETSYLRKMQIMKERSTMARIKAILKEPLWVSTEKVKKKLVNKVYQRRINYRTNIFKNFSQRYINETDYYISEFNIPKNLANQYQYFVAGSDQIWNAYYYRTFIEFLAFAPQEKRISYAASFGISSIPDEYIEDYSKWLSEMNHISVREHAGADIVKELTGRDVEVVLDPTLLLSKEEWLNISEIASDKPMQGYLLTYFLGNVSKERKKYIHRIAKVNNLGVINLAQMDEKTPYLSGPSEFIDYINSAQLFFTDSFHGAAFSIILETPFIVFNREGNSPSMNSRIDTLLGTFKLESRLYDIFTDNNQLFNVDFTEAKSILEVEKEKSLAYLKNALQK